MIKGPGLSCNYSPLYCQSSVSEVLHNWFDNVLESDWPEKPCLADEMYIVFIFENIGQHCWEVHDLIEDSLFSTGLNYEELMEDVELNRYWVQPAAWQAL